VKHFILSHPVYETCAIEQQGTPVRVTGRIFQNERKQINTLCENNKKAVLSQLAKKSRDAVAVLFSLKFADNIHYNFNISQASKARLQSSKYTAAKQNLMQKGHSRSRVLESLERR